MCHSSYLKSLGTSGLERCWEKQVRSCDATGQVWAMKWQRERWKQKWCNQINASFSFFPKFSSNLTCFAFLSFASFSSKEVACNGFLHNPQRRYQSWGVDPSIWFMFQNFIVEPRKTSIWVCKWSISSHDFQNNGKVFKKAFPSYYFHSAFKLLRSLVYNRQLLALVFVTLADCVAWQGHHLAKLEKPMTGWLSSCVPWGSCSVRPVTLWRLWETTVFFFFYKYDVCLWQSEYYHAACYKAANS